MVWEGKPSVTLAAARALATQQLMVFHDPGNSKLAFVDGLHEAGKAMQARRQVDL
jgi:hypothetical protein